MSYMHTANLHFQRPKVDILGGAYYVYYMLFNNTLQQTSFTQLGSLQQQFS